MSTFNVCGNAGKGTLHSKLTLGFFSWPKSIYYCDLSLTSCTFVKLELREQGTNLYGDAREFGKCFCINLEIWNQWLYHGTDNKARPGSDCGVHSYRDYAIAATKSVNIETCNLILLCMVIIYRRPPHISMVDILVNTECPMM